MRKRVWTGILIMLVTMGLSVGWRFLTEVMFVGQNVCIARLIGGAVLGIIGLILWAVVNDL